MKPFALALCILPLVHGCSDVAHQLLDDAKPVLTKDLTDPHSVIFNHLKVVESKDGKVLCGTINWKGGFDTYLGEKRFFYLASAHGRPISGVEGDDLGGMVAAYCD